MPKGTVTHHEWKSKIFPGTIREYWVYVPQQYDAAHPACVMVFQDGHAYVNEKGDFRAPIVLDNLIHKKEMPVTIGIFINPGMHGDALPKDGWKADNRSFEYDTVNDQYAKFLLEEILPEVGKEYKLTDQPAGRGICGSSSGGICSFTVAWQRPDAFSKVRQLHRQLHEHPRRLYLSAGDSRIEEESQTNPRVPARRLARLGQPVRQLAAGQPRNGGRLEIRRLRLPLRIRHRRPRRQTSRRDLPRRNALGFGAITKRLRIARRSRGRFAAGASSLQWRVVFALINATRILRGG